jgi:hypothetical protein
VSKLETKADQIVKKAMLNIMSGKSVIYSKTDLTIICNKTIIRTEAVARLVAVGLLQYGKGFWIEPNRSKKITNKAPKRLIREGWIK